MIVWASIPSPLMYFRPFFVAKVSVTILSFLLIGSRFTVIITVIYYAIAAVLSQMIKVGGIGFSQSGILNQFASSIAVAKVMSSVSIIELQ